MSTTRVAIVTGSGRKRIGWHVADALVRRGHALVLHHYRTSAAQAEESAAHWRTLGGDVLTVRADLTDEKAVGEMVDKTLARFGRVDVLVNCAADWRSKRFEAVTAEAVR